MMQTDNELVLICYFLINTGQDLQHGRDQPLTFILVMLKSPMKCALNLKIYMAFLIQFRQELISVVKSIFRKYVSIEYKGTVTPLVKNHS